MLQDWRLLCVRHSWAGHSIHDSFHISSLCASWSGAPCWVLQSYLTNYITLQVSTWLNANGNSGHAVICAVGANESVKGGSQKDEWMMTGTTSQCTPVIKSIIWMQYAQGPQPHTCHLIHVYVSLFQQLYGPNTTPNFKTGGNTVQPYAVYWHVEVVIYYVLYVGSAS